MGSSSSVQKKKRQTIIFIGNLKNKSLVEQKFFKIAQLYLEAERNVLESERVPVSFENDMSCEPVSQESSNNTQEIEKLDPKAHEEVNDHSKVKEKPCLEVSSKDRNKSSVLSNDPYLFVPLKNTKSLIQTQTYTQWRSCYDVDRLKNTFSKTKKIIYLIQINNFPNFVDEFKLHFDSVDLNFYEFLQKFLEGFFCGMDIKWLPTLDISKTIWNITSRYHHKTNKFQYLVTDFYALLQNKMPKNGYCIMGMTWSDLYPKEELNFVLGEASYHHKSGVFSFGRFEPKTFSDSQSDITEIDTHLLWKLLKVASHELCHLFGLSHCEYFLCAMNQSSSVMEALSQPLFLCPVCVRKLQHVCKFNIMDRIGKLQKIIGCIQSQIPSQKWKDSFDWLEQCRCYLLDDKSFNNQIEMTYL